MSFGFSVGDVFVCAKIALSAYNALKEAPREFEGLALEVLSLNQTLRALAEEASSPNSIVLLASPQRQESLRVLLDNCSKGLTQLELLVTKYPSLGTNQKTSFLEHVKFASKGKQGPRDKLALHTASINIFLTSLTHSSLGRLELLIKNALRVPSQAAGGFDAWSTMGQDLAFEGIGAKDIEKFKSEIMQYTRHLVSGGDPYWKKPIQTVGSGPPSYYDVTPIIPQSGAEKSVNKMPVQQSRPPVSFGSSQQAQAPPQNAAFPEYKPNPSIQQGVPHGQASNNPFTFGRQNPSASGLFGQQQPAAPTQHGRTDQGGNAEHTRPSSTSTESGQTVQHNGGATTSNPYAAPGGSAQTGGSLFGRSTGQPTPFGSTTGGSNQANRNSTQSSLFGNPSNSNKTGDGLSGNAGGLTENAGGLFGQGDSLGQRTEEKEVTKRKTTAPIPPTQSEPISKKVSARRSPSQLKKPATSREHTGNPTASTDTVESKRADELVDLLLTFDHIFDLDGDMPALASVMSTAHTQSPYPVEPPWVATFSPTNSPPVPDTAIPNYRDVSVGLEETHSNQSISVALPLLPSQPSLIREACGRLKDANSQIQEGPSSGTRAETKALVDEISSSLRSAGVLVVSCDVCYAPILDAHFHCRVCASGDWDVCTRCVSEGTGCLGGHRLDKRYAKAWGGEKYWSVIWEKGDTRIISP